MDKELFKKLFINEAKGALLRGGGGGGGSSATVTTEGEGWVGTVVPNEGYVETVYYNNNLSPEEVVDLVNPVLNPDGEEQAGWPLLIDAPGNKELWSNIGLVEGKPVLIFGDYIYNPDTDEEIDRVIFAYCPEELVEGMGYPFIGWNPEITDFSFGFNTVAVPDSTVIGQLSQLFSTTPFVKPQGEPVLLTGEYDGATVKAEEGGDIDVKAMLDEKKLPLTIDAPQKAVALKEGDFLPGSAVPTEGFIEKVYVNTALSNEEVMEILSQLTYYTTSSYHGYECNILCANSNNVALYVRRERSSYFSLYGYCQSTNDDIFGLLWHQDGGWDPTFVNEHNSTLVIKDTVSPNIDVDSLGVFAQIYEYAGTVGEQNELLSKLFSTTPFERDEGESLILAGEYDGTPLKISGSVDLYSLIKNEKKIPFNLELQIWKTYQAIDYLISDNICYFKSNIDQYSYINYDFIPWKDVAEAYILPRTNRISSQAFRNCSNLTAIEISNTVEYIEELAFAGCTSLKNVVIPDSVHYMSSDTFSGCTSLQSVVIKCTNFETLVRSTFLNCTSLTDISLPSSITRIEYSAFENCTNLTNIYYGGTMEQWNAISKGSGWDKNTGDYTIHCTDGDIAKA